MHGPMGSIRNLPSTLSAVYAALFAASSRPAGSDLDFAVNAWVTHTVPVPGTEDGFGGQQQHVAVEAHEWPAQEQQYLLADLADALEAKGLVQGQVRDGCAAAVAVPNFQRPEQQFWVGDLADALEASGHVGRHVGWGAVPTGAAEWEARHRLSACTPDSAFTRHKRQTNRQA